MPAALRCFDNFYSKKNRNADSFIEKRKAQAIYGNMKSVAATGGPQVKQTGGVYYGQLYINGSTQCLVHADSYDTWLSATKGKYYCTPDLSNSFVLNYDSYQGSLLVSDQSNCNVTDTGYGNGEYNTVVYPPPERLDASGNVNPAWDGIITDPSGILFGNKCVVVPFMHPECGSVDLCGQILTAPNTYAASQYAQQVRKQQDLPNFVFPGPLRFT